MNDPGFFWPLFFSPSPEQIWEITLWSRGVPAYPLASSQGFFHLSVFLLVVHPFGIFILFSLPRRVDVCLFGFIKLVSRPSLASVPPP